MYKNDGVNILFCNQCGKQLEENSKFCNSCGCQVGDKLYDENPDMLTNDVSSKSKEDSAIALFILGVLLVFMSFIIKAVFLVWLVFFVYFLIKSKKTKFFVMGSLLSLLVWIIVLFFALDGYIDDAKKMSENTNQNNDSSYIQSDKNETNSMSILDSSSMTEKEESVVQSGKTEDDSMPILDSSSNTENEVSWKMFGEAYAIQNSVCVTVYTGELNGYLKLKVEIDNNYTENVALFGNPIICVEGHEEALMSYGRCECSPGTKACKEYTLSSDVTVDKIDFVVGDLFVMGYFGDDKSYKIQYEKK